MLVVPRQRKSVQRTGDVLDDNPECGLQQRSVFIQAIRAMFPLTSSGSPRKKGPILYSHAVSSQNECTETNELSGSPSDSCVLRGFPRKLDHFSSSLHGHIMRELRKNRRTVCFSESTTGLPEHSWRVSPVKREILSLLISLALYTAHFEFHATQLYSHAAQTL